MNTNTPKVNTRLISEVIDRIIDKEMTMFMAVQAVEEPSCRSDLEGLRLHRKSQFAGWSLQTCQSYLEDLETAEGSGMNLMTLKYARMGNQIPPLSHNPAISFIVDQSLIWQEEVFQRYPNLKSRAREIEDFKNYLSCELETYSDRTLNLLQQDVTQYIASQKSMTLEIYNTMAVLSGFSSLEQLEDSFNQV
jgi:hypothetical protein